MALYRCELDGTSRAKCTRNYNGKMGLGLRRRWSDGWCGRRTAAAAAVAAAAGGGGGGGIQSGLTSNLILSEKYSNFERAQTIQILKGSGAVVCPAIYCCEDQRKMLLMAEDVVVGGVATPGLEAGLSRFTLGPVTAVLEHGGVVGRHHGASALLCFPVVGIAYQSTKLGELWASFSASPVAVNLPPKY